MADRDHLSDHAAEETMYEILAEASGPASPTLTPFVTLGAEDPANELLDAPGMPQPARARDLWETFKKS
ncbi:MAG: hypothetical protein JJE27_03170 [Thermoleophilia bacterium]|nr:hypothetical protein [Thermoleophilia bacterium]